MLVRDKHTHMLVCVTIFTYYCVLAFQKKIYLQWQTPPPPGPPLFLDQTEARRAEKSFL